MTDIIKTGTEQVQDTGDTLVDPVIQHTERITTLEHNLTASEERLNRQLIEKEAELRAAIEANKGQEVIAALEARIVSLEARLEEKATHPVETTEAAPGQAVTFVAPVVEDSGSPPEKERRSIRHRRKNRRAK